MFGGVKGQHLSDLVAEMFIECTDLMNAFVSKPADPLDITNNVSYAIIGTFLLQSNELKYVARKQ